MTDNNSHPPILEKRIVCFIDILGFAELISEASKGEPSTITKIDEALGLVSSIGDKVARLKGSNPAVHIFSDSAIIQTEVSKNAAMALSEALAELTWKLMELGVFIRGAITVGQVSSNRKRPWGPAIVQAYRMESTVASFPRIALHSNFLNYLFQDVQGFMDKVLFHRDDDDGVYFLNTFAHILGQNLPNIPQNVSVDSIEKIRDHLSGHHASATDNPGVYKKINWLRAHWDHQFSAHESLGKFQTDYGYQNDLLRGFRENLDAALNDDVVIDGGTF